MTISILTLFPETFGSVFSQSIIKRAIDKGKVKINLVNIRDFATDRHKTCDDKPYGGGVGMVLRIDVLVRALESVAKKGAKNQKIILLSPQGQLFNQTKAAQLAQLSHLVLICGHYEGVDARISHFIDEELSIGNYILTGGEIAAMVIVDSVTRLIPGVLSKRESVESDSLSQGLLKYDQYTRPPVFRGLKVPDVLLSGNHAQIAKFRKEQAKIKTAQKRPDLMNQSSN